MSGPERAMRMGNVSFGGTAAIVTSVALVVGFDAATVTRAAMVSGLLIVALADNLTDALSMHIYQESDRRLLTREAFTATFSNFIARLMLSLTFVLLVMLLPPTVAVLASAAWGLALLVALTWALAREREVSFTKELLKHGASAVAVVAASWAIGRLLTARSS